MLTGATSFQTHDRTCHVTSSLFSRPQSLPLNLKMTWNGRDSEELTGRSTSLVNLSFRGIGGMFVQNIAADGSVANKLVAKMKFLEAADLYQQTGTDFALLLPSVPPSSMPKVELRTLADQPEELFHPHIKTDLVSIRYETTSSPLKKSWQGHLGRRATFPSRFISYLLNGIQVCMVYILIGITTKTKLNQMSLVSDSRQIDEALQRLTSNIVDRGAAP